MCEWRSRLDPQYHCKVPPEPGSDYCIFHEPGKKDTEGFKQRFYGQIDVVGPEEGRNPRYDFRGYVFPTGVITSGGSRENGELVLPKEISGDVVCYEATIKGDASFGDATIKGDAGFGDVTIEGDAGFGDATIEGKVDFSGTTIEGDAYFWDATIKGGILFDSATVRGDTTFALVEVTGEVSFGGAAFEGNFSFENAKIGGHASFNSATISGVADFTRSAFNRIVSFSETAFLGPTAFSFCLASGVWLGAGRPTIFLLARRRLGVFLPDVPSSEPFWQFCFNSFKKAGMLERTAAAHYFMRIARRKAALSTVWWARPVAVLYYLADLLFLRLTFAYGASLSRTIGTWAAIISDFSVLYAVVTPCLICDLPLKSWSLATFVKATYFSVSTFVTLGLGDLKPCRLWGNALVSIEGIIGGLLMALTVVIIARKFLE